MIRLTAVIEIGGQAPRAIVHESSARTIVIGRDGSADFQIPLSTISRQHARITVTEDVHVLEDLGSTHGTSLNGKKLVPGEKKILRDRDRIELAGARITAAIEERGAAAADPAEGTQAMAQRALQGILGRLGEGRSDGPYLRVLAGPGEGERFSVSGAPVEWTVGRSRECEILLDDPNVSRRHALVKKDWSGYTIQDLDSKNGVLVNDELVHGARRLRDEDEVTIGPVKLVFVDPDAELLDALSHVPGFQLDEPDGARDERSGPDIPGDAAAGDEPELAAIDPALLEPPRSRVPAAWTVVGVGLAVLAVAAAAVVYLLP